MKRNFKTISVAVAAAMTISGMAAVPCYAGIKIPFIGEIGGSSVEDPELESMFGRSLKEMAGKFDGQCHQNNLYILIIFQISGCRCTVANRLYRCLISFC